MICIPICLGMGTKCHVALSRGGSRKHGLEWFINSDLDKDNNSLARVSHEQAVAFLTNTGPTVLIKLIRETPVQVESSDDHVLPSATSSSISLTENLASSKGNILDVSRVSDFGIPAGSAADSAIKHGCAVYDGTQGRNHMPRTGKNLAKRENFLSGNHRSWKGGYQVRFFDIFKWH